MAVNLTSSRLSMETHSLQVCEACSVLHMCYIRCICFLLSFIVLKPPYSISNICCFRIFKDIWIPCGNYWQQRCLILRVCQKGKYSLHGEIIKSLKVSVLHRIRGDMFTYRDMKKRSDCTPSVGLFLLNTNCIVAA